MAWKVLFKNAKSGGTPGLLEFVTGMPTPDWLAYGPFPIIVSSGLHYYTFFFLFMSAALLSIDSSLEEAGELAGAGRWRVMRKITFPLIVPAIASGFIMTFSKTMGTFGGPNVLGVPVQYYTLSTMLRSNTTVGNYGDAFVLAIVLIIIAILAYFFLNRPPVEKSGWDNVKTEQGKDIVKEKETPAAADNKGTENNNEQVIEIIEKTDPENELDFKLYKHRKPVKFTELDRVEQKTVSFLKDYFNVSKNETITAFFTRIREKYLHPKLQDWEFEEYIKREYIFSLGKDKFPVKGERKLIGVYLFPEFMEEKNKFLVSVQVEYIHDGEEIKDIIYLGIGRASDGNESILGHLDNYGWYVQEVIKKYNLEGQ